MSALGLAAVAKLIPANGGFPHKLSLDQENSYTITPSPGWKMHCTVKVTSGDVKVVFNDLQPKSPDKGEYGLTPGNSKEAPAGGVTKISVKGLRPIIASEYSIEFYEYQE